MNVQLKFEELREADLKMEVSICEAEQGEVLCEDEYWGTVKDIINHCANL